MGLLLVFLVIAGMVLYCLQPYFAYKNEKKS
jgi:hypothetical protein